MGRGNQVAIDITTTDKAGLGKLVSKYRAEGKQLGDAISEGFETAERKSTQSQNKMSSAMRGMVSQMTRELDKLERAAALSGDGMSSEYAAALHVIRGDLDRVTEAGKDTGQGLESALGEALRSVGKDIEKLKPATATIDRAFSETGRNIARMLDRIEVEAHNAGDDVGRSMSEAARSMRADLSKVEAQARETGGSLDSEIGDALKRVQAQARKTKAELEDSLKPPDTGGFADRLQESLSGGFDLGGLLGSSKWAGPAAAAGAAIGGLIVKGIQDEWKEDAVGGLISAQTGAATGASERLGDIAGDVFYDSFGESIEQVGESMTAIFQNKLIDTSAPEDAISRITEKVVTLQQTTGESANDLSRSVRQLLVTGLAGNMSQAMDMIQTATEHGLNTTDELLDTIEEYSTQFRSLGLNGQEAFGLIEQAMEGGARNVDVAADALKEFQIRAQDGSATTARGFKSIGLGADIMGQRIAAGGESAKGALRDTLNRLNAMEPGIQRNSAAVDLFGTKAEDLGNALYDMDLDTAAAKFGKFGGSVEEASQKIADSQSTWDKVGKGFGAMANGIGEGIDKLRGDGGIGQIVDQFKLLDVAKEQALSTGDTSGLDELREKYGLLGPSIDEFLEANQGQIDGINEANDATSTYTGTIEGLIDKQRELAQPYLDASAAAIEWAESMAAADEALANNGRNIDINTEKGRGNQSALDDLAEAYHRNIQSMNDAGESTATMTGFTEGARRKFIQVATQMGYSGKAAERLAEKYGLIPKERNTVIKANTFAAQAKLAVFEATARQATQDRIMNIIVRQSTGGLFGWGKETGGIASGSMHYSHAETGGARHGSTMINEAGPEMVQLPSGSKVMTQGATRAALESGLLPVGGGGGGPMHLTVGFDGSVPEALRGLIKGLRFEISNSYGGNVQRALGRGAA